MWFGGVLRCEWRGLGYVNGAWRDWLTGGMFYVCSGPTEIHAVKAADLQRVCDTTTNFGCVRRRCTVGEYWVTGRDRPSGA